MLTGLVKPSLPFLRLGAVNGLICRQHLAGTEFPSGFQLLPDRLVDVAHLMPRLRHNERRLAPRDGSGVFLREFAPALILAQLPDAAEPIQPLK